jgi:hypothetical protein
VTQCLSWLNSEFQRVKEERKLAASATTDTNITVINPQPKNQSTSSSLMDRLASRMSQKPTPQDNEIEAYLKANIVFKKDALEHKSTPLKWWKVGFFIIVFLAFRT